MLRWFVNGVGAVLGLSLCFGFVPAEARAPEAGRPALWAVSDADTTIYLFGTVHVLPPEVVEQIRQRFPEFDHAAE